VAAEFGKNLLDELNFRAEASNILRFNRLYANRKDVKIPELFPRLCTEDTIVMERISGIRLDDLEALAAAGIDRKELARATSRIALEQIMLFGFFHADPHPGNLYAMPGPVVAFMDFGLTGQLPRNLRDELLRLARGAVKRDPGACARSVIRLAGSRGEVDRDRLESDITVLMDTHLGRTLKDINLNACLRDVFEVMHHHKLKTPPELIVLGKALMQFENLGAGLDSDFNILDEARPVVYAIYRERYSPKRFIQELAGRADDALHAIRNLPGDLAPLIETIKSGRMRMDMRVKNLHTLEDSIRQASQRLSAALVTAALLIGSALIFGANEPPHWRGLPVIGLLSLGVSAVAALFLLAGFPRRKGPP
jgi:ubiquinone biosynthesis protein